MSCLNYLIYIQATLAAVGALKSRSISFAGAIRSEVARRKLLTLM